MHHRSSRESRFQYGPLARGIFTAMLCMILLVPYAYPQYAWHYFWLLVFLGIGLRPLLEWTGLYRLFDHLEQGREALFSRKLSKKTSLSFLLNRETSNTSALVIAMNACQTIGNFTPLPLTPE